MSDSVPEKKSDIQTEKSKYSTKVLAAIQDLCTTNVCKPNVKLNDYINKLFPTEQSLSQLDGIISALEQEVDDLDVELAELVEAFGEAGTAGTAALGNVSFFVLLIDNNHIII